MSAGKDRRTERLKAALRENLRRRKVQGRERAAAPAEDGGKPAGPGAADGNGPDSDKSGL